MKAPMKIGKPGVNYYSLLGVPSTATQEEITRAFRKKILHVHLDKMGPEEDTELCYLTIEAHRILSDKKLRQKYDVERSSSKSYKDSEDKFIPAGYICYDVGDQQMSRQLLDSINGWSKDYDKWALSDNYFDCFSQMVEKVIKDGDHHNERSHGGIMKSEYFRCDACDKNFLTETHHWDSVINPYRGMFYSDRLGIPALMSYFETLIGPNFYNWEVRYLPGRLLGIWGSSEWSSLRVVKNEARRILKQCKYRPDTSRPSSSASSSSSPSTSASSSPEPPSVSDMISKLESLLEKTGANRSNASFISAQNSFLKRSLLQNLIWVLENKADTLEAMISRMNDLIMQDDLQEIICLGVAMREILAFENSEWEQLIQSALSHEFFEMAMMWTMLAVQCADKSKGDWFQLGMTIRGMGDAVLAHFCFLLSGCETVAAWEELADIFTQNGLHYAACEYHLNKGNLFQLLHKSRALKGLDEDASSLYFGIYAAARVKGILQVLKNRPRQCSSEANEQYNAEIEELIELTQDLGGNPLEGFRILVSTWPDIFEEAPGHWIHRATIQFLRKGKVNLKSQKLVLAACHFLPEEEMQEEISMVAEDESRLTRQMLELALANNDFEMLTDVLVHFNKRTLDTAEEYLNEIKPLPPPPPKESEENEHEENEGEEEEEKETSEEKTSAPSATLPEPSHKSAMIYLISGTIYKVKELWLDAMKDYQTALLSAPEVMHRVLPCVSKLVQDIQFHEAVVSQVHQEIQDLQRSLKNEEYPNIDEFSSDKRRSLILTDVAPKMDYGYKDAVSRIQPDPDKMPPPPPPDEEQEAPPPPPANTPMVTLDKNEEAIQSGQQDGQIDQLSAALAYVDLLKALPLQMHPGPIVMAASHFLRAMDDTTPVEIGKLYAYRNAIMLMAENLLRIDKKLQHTIHHGLTHKHMLSILLSAHEKLSKALQLAKKNGRDESIEQEEEEMDDDKDDKNKKDLIRQSDAHLISKFLQNVVNFPKVEPLANIPTLNCSDLVYVETLGNSFLSQFCADKVRQKHQSPMIPKHLHAYTHFVEVWKGRSTLSDFPQARVKAMEELVALRGWCMGDVERKMTCPFLLLQDGFSPPLQCLLQLRDPARSYRTIDGFHIDYEKGSVELLFSRDHITPADTLFDHDDIMDVVSLSRAGLDRAVFSLETPDCGMLTSHPFKEARISITGQSKLYNVQQQQKVWSQIPEYVQATLTRVSMLLCYLASGLEMCSGTPFWMRRTDEGLLSRLDEHLQHLARPIAWRKAERRGDSDKCPLGIDSETSKFWLNMVEVFEEIEEEEEEDFCDNNPIVLVHSRQLTYRVGQIRTELRPSTFVMTLDPKNKRERLGPEAEFCRDITRNFQEFSRAFPELARLEELVKISVVCSKLKQVLTENKAMLQELHLSKRNWEKLDDKNGDKLKAISRVCTIIERFLGGQSNNEPSSSTNCNWFPATFCHNMDPDVYDVTAGIELDPVVTYGPVPAPPKSIRVPLEHIIGIEQDLKNEETDEEDDIAVIQQCKAQSSESSESEDEGEEEEEESVEEEEDEEDVDVIEEDDDKMAQEHIQADSLKANLSAVPEESEEKKDGYEELEDDAEQNEVVNGNEEESESEDVSESEQIEEKVKERSFFEEAKKESENPEDPSQQSDSEEESIYEEDDESDAEVAMAENEIDESAAEEEMSKSGNFSLDEVESNEQLLDDSKSNTGKHADEAEFEELGDEVSEDCLDDTDEEFVEDEAKEFSQTDHDASMAEESEIEEDEDDQGQEENKVDACMEEDEEGVPTLTIKLRKASDQLSDDIPLKNGNKSPELNGKNDVDNGQDEFESAEEEEDSSERVPKTETKDQEIIIKEKDEKSSDNAISDVHPLKRSFLSRRSKDNVVVKVCKQKETIKEPIEHLKNEDSENVLTM